MGLQQPGISGVTPQQLNNNLANHIGKIQENVYTSWKK
jgi:hypothetical protein